MIKLQSELVSLIKRKAKNECPDIIIQQVVCNIYKLEQHLDEKISLSVRDITQVLEYLVLYGTITLDISVNDLEFLRARICSNNKNFKNVNELSYIRPTKKGFPAIGRLNKDSEAMFYASIIIPSDKTDTALKTILSEVNARKGDYVNILRSEQAVGQDLNLRILGIWYYIDRNLKPFVFDDKVYEYYREAYKLMGSIFPNKLFEAYKLVDCFLADIMARTGSERLYQVTSIAASLILDDGVDGILYQSIQSKEKTVIALKPTAIDNKVEHKFVSSVRILDYYGYDFYEYETLEKADIDINNIVLQFNKKATHRDSFLDSYY